MSRIEKEDTMESKSFFIEEELGDDYEDAPLTWRGSPSDTFSDCTLVLANKEKDGAKTTYHVHRAVLGASDRRCLFFKKASQKNQSNIEIHLDYKAAQDVFPAMLDFVYFGDLNIHTENAEALRHLAEFFQCRPLRLAVNNFIEADFSVATSIHYVRETYQFNDTPLLTVSIRESAKLFEFIDLDAFVTLEPDLFAAIVADKGFVCADSDKLSKAILHYFYKNPKSLSSKLLVQLTQEIPSIRPTEARALLELVNKLDPPGEDDECWHELTPLCIHCSNAMAPMVWRDDEVKAQDEFFFNGLWAGDGPSRLLVTRLVASLEHAKEQCQIQKQTIEDIQDNAAQSQSDVIELTKKLVEKEEAQVKVVETSEDEESRDDQAPTSPRYTEVCRDLAMSLSHKLNEKEQIILDLDAQLEKKEVELERVGQMMVHLNARLKFYEILHNDSKAQPVLPRKAPTASFSESLSARSISSSAPTSPTKSDPPSQRIFKQSRSPSAPTSPTKAETPQKMFKQSRSPSRPETPRPDTPNARKPPTSPRFNFRPTVE